MDEPITFGTAYYPDHWPESEWERDLKLIHDSGINVVRFGEFSWSWIAPKPGVFDFSHYDHFMDLAERCGLKVMLCTPTCNPPHWFFARYPDARQLDQYNRPHIGHRHMACYNHPAALDAALEVVFKLANQYRDHPALSAWQIDNELTAGESGSLEQLYDYHVLTLTRYRDYLRQRYDSLDVLNEIWWNNFWGNRYSAWDEIDPPRPGLTRNISPSMWLEWSRFRAENVAEFGRLQLDWLRSIRREFRIGINVPEVSPLQGALLGQDYWLLCRDMDFIGTDLYVYTGDDTRDQQRLAFSSDIIRSAAQAQGASFGVLETQAGPHIRPWRMGFAGGDWTPDFLERCVQTYASHSAEFIYFFLWRPTLGGAEFGMNGLVHRDGSESERSRALPSIIENAEQARHLLTDRPEICIHYSADTLQLLSLYDPDQSGDSALLGWHTLLEDLGFRVNFVSDAELLQPEAPTPPPLILAQSLVLDETLCDRLAESKRMLIAAGAPAYFDGYARVYPVVPGGHLADRFGLRIEAFEANRAAAENPPWSDGQPLLRARIHLEHGCEHNLDDRGVLQAIEGHNCVYFNVDVGTLYHRSSPEIRAQLRAVIGPHVSQ